MIYDVDPTLSEEDIMRGTTVEPTDSPIAQVIRIKRTITADEEPTLINTDKFKVLCNNDLPQFLHIYSNFREVQQYVPPVLRCRRCQSFTHSTNSWHQEYQTCVKCANTHDEGPCNFPLRCANCDEPHRADNKRCYYFLFYKEVAEIKASLKCSRKEAIFRARELEKLRANSSSPLSLQRNPPTFPTRTFQNNSINSPRKSDVSQIISPSKEAKSLGRKYATKCIDKFVESMNELFDNFEGKLYEEIKVLSSRFKELEMSPSTSASNATTNTTQNEE